MSSVVQIQTQQTISAPKGPKGPNGKIMDETSDNIDELNRLRALIRGEPIDEASEAAVEARQTLFRQYNAAKDHVKDFYEEQHAKQTYEFNVEVRKYFDTRKRVPMTVWQAMERLQKYVDQSDPDTEVGQIEHLLQTAEAMRRDGRPRWMQFTGLIHDLGKLWSSFGANGQWDVVGDTFPVGCAFEDSNILNESFKSNPDYNDPRYNTKYGVYKPNCGLDNVMMSWGHDEYLYLICREQSNLPEEALAMIRYHSFYALHSEGGYRHLMSPEDLAKLAALKEFNPFDLYSKADEPPNVEELKPYYLELIDEFMPGVINW
ncbi:hypothetical protein DSL72_003333 [Monilinia vaccinii-corymbosi]|uniref:Inositol oxygenase n=1 Tax=Monilinia vaccinii-corymbosi TaxID=61207 RepID=A0A8A3P5P7_9HELO|nr:hypothetical protein DSL72_003333 [Monilinia vaccinii-corymbosi]